MRIVDLAGSPERIGVEHGRALADEIRSHLERWRGHLHGRGIPEPKRWIGEFVERAGFVDHVRSLAPQLAAEVDGIAHGAGLAPADAWFLQLMDESWPAVPLAPGAGAPGGTTFGVVNGLRSWSGQTIDLEGFRAGAEAVLRIQPDEGAPQLVVTMAGCVGLFGVSRVGFSVFVNALAQVPRRDSGLPVAFVVRSALAAGGFAAAVEAVREAPHATGQHYLVAGNELLASTECSPEGVVAVQPGSGRTWHTDHPLVGYVPEPGDEESDARWEAVRPLMKLPSWGTVRTRQLLELPAVCRPRRSDGDAETGADVCTFAAAYVEQTLRATHLWVTAGAPDADAWQHVTWP